MHVYARKLGIAGGGDQAAVEILVEVGDLARLDLTPVRLDQPDRLKLVERGAGPALEKPLDRRALEDDAQVVEFVEPGEVEGADRPTAAKSDIDIALSLKAIERVANRCTRDPIALGQTGFRE